MIELIKEIPQNSDIFRAVTKKSWIRNDVSYNAFLLRTEKGETELSVLLKADCSKEICEATLENCFGEIILKAEAFRNFALEIKHTPIYEPKYIPYHASVYNLPASVGESEANARNIAVELANQATIQPRPKE